MFGYAEVDDLAPSVADHEPGVQQSEPCGGDDKEVHRGDLGPMITKERAPSLALIAVGISFREGSRDGGKTNEDPELLEFGSNLPGTPAVFVCESANERLHLGWNRRPTGSGLRDRSPVQPESLSMPANHGVGLDDDQDFLPSRPDTRDMRTQKPRSAGAIRGRRPFSANVASC